jgi:CheY-like chemotaxis protein
VPTRPLRILVADDEHDAANMLSLLLQAHGHNVIAVTDGGSVVEEVLRERPDVALLDIRMGVHSGYDIARAIREHTGGRISLVAVTGLREPADHAQAMLAGFNHYLTKPFNPQTLLTLLQRLAIRP